MVQRRTVTSRFEEAAFAPETGEAVLALLTMDHPNLSDPLRFTSDAQMTTSRGNDYLAYPFDIVLPSEEEEEVSSVQLQIDNVDREIVKQVRGLSGPLDVTLEVVLASDPDNVQVGPIDFELSKVTYNRLVVKGKLSFENLKQEAFPKDRFTPEDFPGLFSQ